MLGLSYYIKFQEIGAFMIKSVQQFYDNGIKKLENIFVEYSTDFTEVTEMVGGVAKSII